MIRTVDQMCECLTHVAYSQLVKRLKSGEIKIEFGFDKWKEEWYSSNAWENRSFPFFFEFILKVPEANNFKFFYDPVNDFHHIEFVLAGKTYDVRWYKVFGVSCGTQSMTFNRNHDSVINFFTSGLYKKENW